MQGVTRSVLAAVAAAALSLGVAARAAAAVAFFISVSTGHVFAQFGENVPPEPRPIAQEVLDECLEQLEKDVEKVVERYDTLVERAEFRLEVLGERGASERSILRAASSAKKPFSSVARSGQAALNRTVGRCMIRLRKADGYEREMQDELFFRQEVAVESIRDALEAARERVDEAAAAAIAASEDEDAES